MKLVNADNINFHCNYDSDCTGAIEDCKECSNYICNFRDIQEQPIAYDIDKVVEDIRCRCYEMGLDESQTEIIVSEIIKQGVVYDDVCECRLINGYNFLFKTSCGNVFEIKNGFKWCPYCRKRISISEVKQ